MPGPVVVDAADDVSLRTVERTDLDFLHRWQNHPTVRRWMPRSHPVRRPRLVEEFEGWLSDREDGLQALVCLDSKPDGEGVGTDDGNESDAADESAMTPVGFVSLFDEHPVDRSAVVSAWVVPRARGRGVASAAIDSLLAHAFDERNLEKLVAGAIATNEPSQATLEGAGFEQEARVRERYFVDGEFVDRIEYGLLADAWRTRNGGAE